MYQSAQGKCCYFFLFFLLGGGGKIITFSTYTLFYSNTWRRLYTNGKISEANEKCVHNMAAWLINEAIAKYEHMKTVRDVF